VESTTIQERDGTVGERREPAIRPIPLGRDGDLHVDARPTLWVTTQKSSKSSTQHRVRPRSASRSRMPATRRRPASKRPRVAMNDLA